MNLPGASVSDQIMKATFEPLLLGLVEKLKNDGWIVTYSHGEIGYVIEFGMPGEKAFNAAGDSAADALSSLLRSMSEAGALPKELREMQLMIEQQTGPGRNAVSDALRSELESTRSDQ